MKKRVAIVEDHPIVREGFVQLINQERDLEVVGEAWDINTGLEVYYSKKPDIMLIDLSLKNANGLELIKSLKAITPDLPMLVVSLHNERIYAERALRAGARGFIMKEEATENIMAAIRAVLNGTIYLSNSMRELLLQRITGKKRTDFAEIELLSDREFEIFQLIGNGHKTKDIADKLNLSIKTIETHKAHIKGKLKLKDATELIQYAVEWTIDNVKKVY